MTCSNITLTNDSISGNNIPNDPKTGQPYEYSTLVAKCAEGTKCVGSTGSEVLHFELCANFDLNNKDQLGIKPMMAYPIYGGENSQNWDHGVGKVCFERNIDKQLYPILDKPIK